MSTVVDTQAFERSHGRAPRRDAYGAWLFATPEGVQVELTGEYRDVKRRLTSELGAGQYALLP